MNLSRYRKAFAAALAAALPAIAQAQSSVSANSLLDNTKTLLTGIGDTVVTIVQIVIGLAAAVLLVMIFIEGNKSQSNSKDRLITLFVFLVISFIALQLISTYVIKG